MLELALRDVRREPVRLRDIAEPHGIPSPFLVQILLQLKSVGLVESTRGAAGGYRLARRPDTISLADIVDAIEGTTATVAPAASATAADQVLQDVWQRLRDAQHDWLAQTTLAELVERVRGAAAKMYYI